MIELRIRASSQIRLVVAERVSVSKARLRKNGNFLNLNADRNSLALAA